MNKYFRGWWERLTGRTERRLEAKLRTAEASERRWEGCYEAACVQRDELRAERDRLRERCEQWETMAKEQRERAQMLEKRADVLREECRMREVAYQRKPAFMVNEKTQERKDLERLLVLAGMAESNPIWQTVLSYADEAERTEREAALRPDLIDAQRQYNAGRAGQAYDFAMALRDLWVKAQLEAQRRKAA